MKKTLLATVAAGLVFSASAFANETVETQTVEMLRITPEGVGAPVGSVTLEDTFEGVMVHLNVKDMAPGVQRLRLVQEAECQPIGLNTPYRELTYLYTGIDEDGALPTKTSFLIEDMTIEGLRGEALVTMNGGQFADQQNAMTGLPSEAACGIIPAN